MSLASAAAVLGRRRRQLVLGTVVVLLHLIVFDWIGGQVGLPRVELAHADSPMLAQLIDEAPPPMPAPTPPPAPKDDLPPLPDLDPEPLPEPPAPPPPATPTPAQADAPAGDAPAGDAGPRQAGTAGDGAGAGGDQAGQGAGAPAQAAATPPAVPPAPAQPPPAPEVRRYKVDMPPSSDITLNVARVDADGTHWSGEELLSWRISPSSYRIQVEAGIGVIFTRVNLLTVTSEGTVGDDGFVPTLMTEKRRGRAMTATHFNRDAGTVTFSASQASYPLAPGTQDKASVPLQLVAIARGDPKQLSGKIDIFVGEDRDASVFSFTVLGQEEIDTPLGRIATWHLSRPPKPGSYNSRLDLWLAPAYGWLPVQIRNLEASGAVTTQTARSIVKKDSGNP